MFGKSCIGQHDIPPVDGSIRTGGRHEQERCPQSNQESRIGSK